MASQKKLNKALNPPPPPPTPYLLGGFWVEAPLPLLRLTCLGAFWPERARSAGLRTIYIHLYKMR